MDLELATLEDIANELASRELRFALVAIEDTNAQFADAVWFAGQGVNHQDVSNLFEAGRQVFEIERDEARGREAE